MTIIVGLNNDFTQSWDVTAGVGTLVISNNTYFDLGLTDIVRIEDTTTGLPFGISATTTFSNTFASGKPTYTWTFGTLPAGTATGDTLLVYLNVNPEQAELMILQYQKA